MAKSQLKGVPDTLPQVVRWKADGVDDVFFTASRDNGPLQQEVYDLIRIMADFEDEGQSFLGFLFDPGNEVRGEIYLCTRMPDAKDNTAFRILSLGRGCFGRNAARDLEGFWLDPTGIQKYAQELMVGQIRTTRPQAAMLAIQNVAMASLVHWPSMVGEMDAIVRNSAGLRALLPDGFAAKLHRLAKADTALDSNGMPRNKRLVEALSTLVVALITSEANS